ncbi:tetratricopeptide repeat protein, partial [Acidobacteriota bacterium]
NQGWEFVSKKDYRAATKVFKKAIKLRSRCADCFLRLTVAYNKQGKYENALDAARQALELSEAADVLFQAKTYNQLGIALRGSDPEDPEKTKEAAAAYRKVLELTEGKVEIVEFNLARALTAQADTDKKLDAKDISNLYMKHIHC